MGNLLQVLFGTNRTFKQNKAIKIVAGSKRYKSVQCTLNRLIYAQSKTPSLDKLFKFETATFVHQIIIQINLKRFSYFLINR